MRRQPLLRRREGLAAKTVDGASAAFAHEPQGFERKAAAIQRCQHRRQFTLDHHQSGAAIAEDVLELRAARGDIDRNRDGAEPGGAQDGEKKLSPVPAHDSDAVAGLDARRSQRRGVAGGCLGRRRVGEGDTTDRDQSALPVPLGLELEHPRYGPLATAEKAAAAGYAAFPAAHSRART